MIFSCYDISYIFFPVLDRLNLRFNNNMYYYYTYMNIWYVYTLYVQLTTSDTIFILYIVIYYCEIENCTKIILLSFYNVALCRLNIARRYYSCKKKKGELPKMQKTRFVFNRLTLTTTWGYTFINNTLRLKLKNLYPWLVTSKL